MNDPVPPQGEGEGTRLPELRVTTPKPVEAVVPKPPTMTKVAPPQMPLQESSEAPTAPSTPAATTPPVATPPAPSVPSTPPERAADLKAPTAIDGATPATPERHITIAFDGGCIGNPGPGGYGAILVNDRTGSEKIVKGREAATTNNRMELRAAIEGLNALRPGAYVHMLGDSQYVIKGFTEWLPDWKAKSWTASGGKQVANVELWRALEVAVERHRTVTWEWVRGHNGHELNERADRIANKEATQAHRIHRVSP